MSWKIKPAWPKHHICDLRYFDIYMQDYELELLLSLAIDYIKETKYLSSDRDVEALSELLSEIHGRLRDDQESEAD